MGSAVDRDRAISGLGNWAGCISMAIGERGASDAQERLCALEEKIIVWSSDETMIWDREPQEASEFLQVVDATRILTEDLENLRSNVRGEEQFHLLGRAHSSLQTAMTRLEDEFAHLLIQNQQPVEPEHMSFRSVEDEFGDYSCSSFEEETVQGKTQGESGKGAEEFVIDLIHPNAVFDLRCIAELMFLSNYDKECCQTYIGLRKDAMDEYLLILQMEKLSIEEVLRMDWRVLNSMIQKWNRAMKLFVRVYLASEKRLLDLVFGDFPAMVRESCFTEISKGPILQLLNFGEAIALGPPKPEKLFRILDMYDGLAGLLGDIESIFPNESCSSIMNECHEVLQRLGEFVKGTLAEFKSAIHSNTSTTPLANGGVHLVTNYVMNYAKTLVAYNEALTSILEEPYSVKDEAETNSCSSPIVPHLQSMTSLLETNLESRSKLYRDSALQSFFLMNNIVYMVQKVKNSDLRTFLGDDWILAHTRKFHQHAVAYERASWPLILSYLKDEGVCSPGSASPSKTVLKERFKRFNFALAEIYRVQTAWVIPDLQLREDMRISASLKVLQAYRTFMGRYSHHLDGVRNRDKYIKYLPDDLQKYLLDLFEGSPKVLH